MKRYWDYSDQERATLSAEQVEKLLAYELMEQGVLAVEPLKLEDLQPVDLPARRVFLLREVDGYARDILPIAFDDLAAAEAVRDRIVLIRERDGWQGPFFTRPASKVEIIAEDLPTKDAVLAAKVPLEEQQRREAANSAARRAFEEASKKVADATKGVWDDWYACREAETRHQKIRDTLAEYLRMTEGNESMARSFLAKVFPTDEIEAAVGRSIVGWNTPARTDDPMDDACSCSRVSGDNTGCERHGRKTP